MFKMSFFEKSGSEQQNKKEKYAELQKNQFQEKISRILNEAEQKQVMEAFDFMIDLHLNQEDRVDGTPYFMHLVSAANNVIDFGVKDPDIIISALLHDSVEDQNVKLAYKYLNSKLGLNLEEKEKPAEFVTDKMYQSIALKGIENKFGKEVREIIKAVTNPIMEDVVSLLDDKYKKNIKFLTYKTQIDYKTKDEKVFIVKLADLLNNVMKIDGPKKEFFQKKYGPVLKDIILPKLRETKKGDLLFENKDKIISEFESIYKNNFEIND